MSKEKIVFIGGGGHSLSCLEVLLSGHGVEILGVVDKDPKAPLIMHGYPYLGKDEIIDGLVERDTFFIIGLGQVKTAKPRMKIYHHLKTIDANIKTIIASSAVVSEDVKMGAGCSIFHNATVNSGVILGDNTIINSGAIVEHNCTIGHHCHIAPNATILGGAIIEDCCLIGAGAVILPGVKIGKNAIIGAGAVIKHNLEDESVIK